MELKQGTLLQNGKYRIEKVLGQGSFGITYLATMKTKVGGNLGNMEATVKVAIKEFFMSDMDGRDGSMVTYSRGNVLHENYKEKFRKESEKLSKLSHRNIVKVLDSFAANNTYYYVMEYCAGGSLDEMIYRRGGLGEAEALAYTKDICLALSYMHSHKMLHLDLKPSNIMLRSSGEAVLIDFGLSKEYDKSGKPETSTTIGLGTKGYAPLEQSNYNKGDSKVFPVTMDVYAMGGTIYKMLTSQTPPEASEILNSGFPVGELKSRGISNDLIEALEQAMSPMVKGRPQSIKGFIEILGGTPTSNNLNYSNSSHTSKDEVTIITGVPCKENEIKDTEIFEVNGVTFKMIKVEGGTFQMGATPEQGNDASNNETPVHSVTLSDYYIGETEVTQELWEAVMGSNPSSHKGKQRPVERVSWNDCQCFLEKLTYMTGKGFRLPTEAEWEYAARGGRKSKNHKFSGGNYIDNVAVYGRGVFKKTTDVKTKMPNELGIYDMSGNVWEWCQDWYGSNYYSSSPQYNPQGPSSGSYRVLRGGSWNFYARGCRVSNRGSFNPDGRGNDVGLRLSFS